MADQVTMQGDCLDVMQGMADASVTAVVTDPPYALEFMGKGWDKVLPSDEVWEECLRVLKPGGMLLAFGGEFLSLKFVSRQQNMLYAMLGIRFATLIFAWLPVRGWKVCVVKRDPY